MTVTTTVSPARRPRSARSSGEEGQEHVAVGDRAGVVHGDDPVGVAVEGQAEVGAPVLHHGQREPARDGSSRSGR